MSFGVFQEYYGRLPAFSHDYANIATIGTLATSINFLGAPFIAPLVKKCHAWQRWMVIAGSIICVISLVAASFANTVALLIITQGFFYGTGFLIVYIPLLSMLNEWFVQRRGLAYGVLYAGGGASGVGFPFLMEWLLHNYGYATALRGIAVAQLILLAPTMILIRGRLPSARGYQTSRTDLDFISNPHFWILTLSNLLQGFAFYIPFIYLPTFATMVGLSPRVGALLLAALNVASTLGQVGFGFLSDRLSNVFILVFVTTFISSIASFCIWGFAHSLAPLLVFAIVFGCFGGAYVVLWPKFSLLADEPQFVYSTMAFGKGLGSIATGPVTAGLISGSVSSGYGIGKYQNVIIFMGSLMFASSLGIIGWPLKGSTIRKV
jgi:MFS family permease